MPQTGHKPITNLFSCNLQFGGFQIRGQERKLYVIFMYVELFVPTFVVYNSEVIKYVGEVATPIAHRSSLKFRHRHHFVKYVCFCFVASMP